MWRRTGCVFENCAASCGRLISLKKDWQASAETTNPGGTGKPLPTSAPILAPLPPATETSVRPMSSNGRIHLLILIHPNWNIPVSKKVVLDYFRKGFLYIWLWQIQNPNIEMRNGSTGSPPWATPKGKSKYQMLKGLKPSPCAWSFRVLFGSFEFVSLGIV